MGGKGQRRREKNYRAAHGVQNRLPPPPDPSAVDALPSKLRKLMSFTNPGSAKVSVDSEQRSRRDGRGVGRSIDKKVPSSNKFNSKTSKIEGEGNQGNLIPLEIDDDSIVPSDSHEKKRKKRKRKQVHDLRFENAEELGHVGLKRKERRKKRLQERKKKCKKSKDEENLDFPGCEKIKFGEVVEAPPKLVALPKAMKTVKDALQQKRRLETIEAYRNQRGWESRPGIKLPIPEIAPSSL